MGNLGEISSGLSIKINEYVGLYSGSTIEGGNTIINFTPSIGSFSDGETYGVVFKSGS